APIVAQAERAGMKVSVKKDGDQFDYGGAHFRMLAPGRDQITGSMRPNDDCLVFTATFGGTTALLEGDAERPAERRVVEEHPEAMLLNVYRSAADRSSPLCGDFCRRAKRLRTSPARSAATATAGWS